MIRYVYMKYKLRLDSGGFVEDWHQGQEID